VGISTKDDSLQLVSPFIGKEGTVIRNSFQASQRFFVHSALSGYWTSIRWNEIYGPSSVSYAERNFLVDVPAMTTELQPNRDCTKYSRLSERFFSRNTHLQYSSWTNSHKCTNPNSGLMLHSVVVMMSHAVYCTDLLWDLRDAPSLEVHTWFQHSRFSLSSFVTVVTSAVLISVFVKFKMVASATDVSGMF
jgi:hypothetical protein